METSIETMNDAKRVFFRMLEGPLTHAKTWNCTSVQLQANEIPVKSPPGARPLCATFDAGDGRRVVIAAWFPPEDGPPLKLCMDDVREKPPELTWDQFNQFQVPMWSVVTQLGEWHSVIINPTADWNAPYAKGTETIIFGIFFRFVDGKIRDLSTDPTQWNAYLDERRGGDGSVKLPWDQFEQPAFGHVTQLDEWYAAIARPLVGPPNERRPVTVGCYFRLVNDEVLEHTADPTEWNRHLDTQRSKSPASRCKTL